MTDFLHLPADPRAPILCDMSSARDTPEERLGEYAELFERALERRERGEHHVVFVLRALPGTREQVVDLARREAACCPFLEYRVRLTGAEVIYTITDPVAGLSRAEADVTLDAFYALPDHAGSDYAGLLDRLADGGMHVMSAGDQRWELRDTSSLPSAPRPRDG